MSPLPEAMLASVRPCGIHQRWSLHEMLKISILDMKINNSILQLHLPDTSEPSIAYTVYPMKYARIFFAMFSFICCYFHQINILRLVSLVLGQLYYCPVLVKQPWRIWVNLALHNNNKIKQIFNHVQNSYHIMYKNISCDIAYRWMPLNTFDDKSTQHWFR